VRSQGGRAGSTREGGRGGTSARRCSAGARAGREGTKGQQSDRYVLVLFLYLLGHLDGTSFRRGSALTSRPPQVSIPVLPLLLFLLLDHLAVFLRHTLCHLLSSIHTSLCNSETGGQEAPAASSPLGPPLGAGTSSARRRRGLSWLRSSLSVLSLLWTRWRSTATSCSRSSRAARRMRPGRGASSCSSPCPSAGREARSTLRTSTLSYSLHREAYTDEPKQRAARVRPPLDRRPSDVVRTAQRGRPASSFRQVDQERPSPRAFSRRAVRPVSSRLPTSESEEA